MNPTIKLKALLPKRFGKRGFLFFIASLCFSLFAVQVFAEAFASFFEPAASHTVCQTASLITFAADFMETKQTVKPYNASDSKKLQVEKMFDRVAPTYDLLNRVLSLGIDVSWRKRAISYLSDLQPQRILDVATGTADVAILMEKHLHPQQIIGVDISNEMLEVGRQKIRDRQLSEKIQLETGDSENLRFQNGEFDAVTVAFGVRNFENLEKGLAEMSRVLREGGRVVILEFSRPHIFPFKQLYNAYFKYVLPLIGRLTSRDPRAYTYLFESVQAFPEGNQFIEILIKTGFKNPRFERLTLGICTIYIAEK